MPTPARPRVRFPRPLIAPVLAGALLSACGGCSGLPALGGPGFLPPLGGARTADLDDDAEAGDDEAADSDIQLAGAEGPAGESPFYGDDDLASRPSESSNPLTKSRQWLNRLTGVKGEADVSAARLPPEARRSFENARNGFDRGEYDDAAAAFKTLSRRYADTAIEEDALFYRAEALYKGDSLAPAQDAYDALLDRYPSTRHLDAISQRQFAIARRWLGYPEGVISSDVKPVSYAEVAAGVATPPPAERLSKDAPPRPSDPTILIPVLPNFHDKTRPLFDTTGRALQGLKSVWMNDPTGDLADDALFLSAGHYLRKGDYMEAGRLYDILRKEYPDSPHLKDAYLLGAHTREVVWQGPMYDDQGLKESRRIKESFQRLFPDEADRARIAESLENMAEAEAEADWATLQLYERKGKTKSVAIYARKILVDHPGSRAAARARKIWDALPADAKALAGPAPPAPTAAVERRVEAPPVTERSVRPPVAREPMTREPVTREPMTREPAPAARPAVAPDALPGSTQAPDAPFDPFSGDPFSGDPSNADPFG
ncbi:tetratricopeptide repeat protein [Alienimonas chondri]|uniref:Outer membrane protein assembly factor BamD n=1 Tax=Alienimonas chondri TaxID=2681879 RepID=A0ABX1VHE8_9PLAN|nr:tetratricopeptide repeat protein [Alienimonas chondri]NNJ27537.1 Outer membrane protein assembly factor BamD [Alienimonas chondri]